jgi:hypothetical protein
MDPYLEGELWQEFHERLANQISTQLLSKLPARYVALLAKRYVIDQTAVSLLSVPSDSRVIYPDVHVVENLPRVAEAAVAYPSGATPPTASLPGAVREEVPVLSVEIRDVADRRLVTVIEILSPANKRGEGAQEYAGRRARVLATETHLLEIDLLRRGQRIALDGELPPGDYFAYLTRAENHRLTDVWSIALRDTLPVLPVPLLPPDDDALLDLQRAVDDCFALVRYERLLDYTVPPPPPPLSEEASAWLAERLAAGATPGSASG